MTEQGIEPDYTILFTIHITPKIQFLNNMKIDHFEFL